MQRRYWAVTYLSIATAIALGASFGCSDKKKTAATAASTTDSSVGGRLSSLSVSSLSKSGDVGYLSRFI